MQVITYTSVTCYAFSELKARPIPSDASKHVHHKKHGEERHDPEKEDYINIKVIALMKHNHKQYKDVNPKLGFDTCGDVFYFNCSSGG